MRLVRDEIRVMTVAVLEVVDKKYSQRSDGTGGNFTARVDAGNVEKCKTACEIGKLHIH